MTAGLVLFADLLASINADAAAFVAKAETIGKAAAASAADIAKMNGELDGVDEMKALIVVDVHRSQTGSSSIAFGGGSFGGSFGATNPSAVTRPGGSAQAATSPRITPELRRFLGADGAGGLDEEGLRWIEAFIRNADRLARPDLSQQERQLQSLMRQGLIDFFGRAFGGNIEELARQLAAFQRYLVNTGAPTSGGAVSRTATRPAGSASLGILQKAGVLR